MHLEEAAMSATGENYERDGNMGVLTLPARDGVGPVAA
jgi:hypothetical protein